MRSGLRDVSWPGRLEVIRQDPLTVIDVGHTPDGIRQSLASLKAIHGAEGWILVIGISGDKKADEIVGALAPSFDTIICTRRTTRARTPTISPSAVRKANPQADVHVAATVAEAVAMSQQTRRRARAKDLRGRRTVPGDRIRHRRARRPRGGFEVFLNVAHNPASRIGCLAMTIGLR